MRSNATASVPLLVVVALALASSAAVAQMPGAAPFGRTDDASADAVVNLNAYAEYKMGHYDAARTIWEGLAAKGNTTALINLSNLFSQGGGVTADQTKAYAYTLKAAELGDPRAQHDIGLAYEKGSPVPRDIEKAADWLKKSAAQNYADGEFAYGVLLATGRGKGLDKVTDADKAEAIVLAEEGPGRRQRRGRGLHQDAGRQGLSGADSSVPNEASRPDGHPGNGGLPNEKAAPGRGWRPSYVPSESGGQCSVGFRSLAISSFRISFLRFNSVTRAGSAAGWMRSRSNSRSRAWWRRSSSVRWFCIDIKNVLSLRWDDVSVTQRRQPASLFDARFRAG